MLSGEYSSQCPIERECGGGGRVRIRWGGEMTRQADSSNIKAGQRKPGLETISKLLTRGTRGEDKSWSGNKDTCTHSHAYVHALSHWTTVRCAQCVGFPMCAFVRVRVCECSGVRREEQTHLCSPLSSSSRWALGSPALSASGSEATSADDQKLQKFWKAERFVQRNWQTPNVPPKPRPRGPPPPYQCV